MINIIVNKGIAEIISQQETTSRTLHLDCAIITEKIAHELMRRWTNSKELQISELTILKTLLADTLDDMIREIGETNEQTE